MLIPASEFVFVDDDFDTQSYLPAEEQPETQDNYFDNLSTDEKEQIAKDSLKKFFSDKSLRIGGKIPEHMLVNQNNIDLLLYLSISDAVQAIYAALPVESTETVERASSEADLLPATRKLIDTLDGIAERAVPKGLAGGILFLYYKHCEGLRLVNPYAATALVA